MNKLDAILGTKTVLRLIPAYGRRYTNKHDMLEDWNSGKDFKIVEGPFTSIRDIAILKNDYDKVILLIPFCFFVEV